MNNTARKGTANGSMARQEIEDFLQSHRHWRLRFPDELEDTFRDHHDEEAAWIFRGSLAWLFLLYLVLGGSALVLGEWAELGVWPYSFAGFGIVLLAGMVVSYTELLHRYYQRVVSLLAGIAMALSMVNPALLEDPPFRLLMHVGTMYTIMVIYLGLSLRLPYALLAGWGGGLPVLFLLWWSGEGLYLDWDMVLATYFGASVLSGLLCYRDERQKRRLFLHTQLQHYDRLRIEKLVAELEELSLVDALTGLANRRRFDEILEHEWARCQRERRYLSLIFADVDRFKAYNDCYGHQQGDECLRRLARVLTAAARRPADLAARYGGEEFVLLLPDTDPRAAARIAAELLEGVEALGMPHPHSDCASVVTISAGVASLVPGQETAPRQLVQLADEALYRAKQEGRNRLRTASPEALS